MPYHERTVNYGEERHYLLQRRCYTSFADSICLRDSSDCDELDVQVLPGNLEVIVSTLRKLEGISNWCLRNGTVRSLFQCRAAPDSFWISGDFGCFVYNRSSHCTPREGMGRVNKKRRGETEIIDLEQIIFIGFSFIIWLIVMGWMCKYVQSLPPARSPQ